MTRDDLDEPRAKYLKLVKSEIKLEDDSSDERKKTIDDLDDSKFNIEWTSEDFLFGKPLGKGRFGKVFLAKEKRTKFEGLVALKILSKRMLEESNTMINFKREYEIQKDLEHPNVLKMHGFFHNEKRIYLILEYAPNGSLYKKLENGPFDDYEAATYVYQTARALMYIHSKNIVHRDIKPENLLIGYWGEIKLADFGWANICKTQTVTENIENCQSLAGTLDYLCPEMILKHPHDTKVDNWCLGVLCYEMLTSKAPFHADDNEKTIQLILKVKYQFPNHVSSSAQSFISKLLVRDAKKRIDLSNVLKDDWVIKYADRTDSYLNYFRPSI